MTCNVGRIDQIIRALAGILLAVAGSLNGWLWLLIIGLILLLTSLIRFCPIYAVLKLSSCAKTAAEPEKKTSKKK